jgi:type VI secretion system secreted protein VgrG
MSDVQAEAGSNQRLLSLQTALGQDVLQPVSFHAEEAINAPFLVTVETVCDQPSIDPDEVLYHPACLKVQYGPGDPRILHGIVRAFSASGEPVRGQYSYTLTIVPKLWFMGQTIDCRIFANKSIADILTAICGDNGQTLSLKVYGDKPVRPYVTQYNETDVTFLSRLVEEAGYFYYFTHAEGDHTLVITDQNQGFPQNPKPTMRVVHEGGGTDVFTQWHKVETTAHGKVRLRDYDPLKPNTLPDGQQQTTLATSGAPVRDVFQWPALATTQDEASSHARLRMEAAEAEAKLFEAVGENHLFAPGSRFTVERDPFDDGTGVEYVVRGVSHSGQDHSWVTGESGASYANRITAFPVATVWREKFVTPRPAMTGIHSAIVLGGDGEEIHADQYGRVKVRFFWDHRNDATADTACWVRVVQPWAGNTWGWQHLPRVGTEVAVAFLDGDPDRPVVIGGFYNGQMMPVFPIPDEQTKSGFRSRSTTQGSTSTVSELSFDDKKGQEKVFLHAEKDMTVEVEHDQTITVDNDRSLTVKQKETIEVDDSQTITVKNGRTTTIEAAGDQLTVKNGGITITASQSDISITASMGSITMEAMNSIELKVGANSVKIDQTGVTVSATQIKLSGQAMVQIEAPMTKVNADGMLMLKGGIMMLN